MTQKTSLSKLEDILERSKSTPVLYFFKTMSGFFRWSVNEQPKESEMCYEASDPDKSIEDLLKQAEGHLFEEVELAGDLVHADKLLLKFIQDGVVSQVVAERNQTLSSEFQLQENGFAKVLRGHSSQDFKPYVATQEINGFLEVRLVNPLESYVVNARLPENHQKLSDQDLTTRINNTLKAIWQEW